jgi:hypothetical protein
LTDLAFNVHAPQPWWTGLFMYANAGWARFGPTRVLKSTIKDRAHAQAGVAALVAHGDVMASAARAARGCTVARRV